MSDTESKTFGAMLIERCEKYAGAIGTLERTLEHLDALLECEAITSAQRATARAEIELRRSEIRDLFADG